MASVREAWTDERLDNLTVHMDGGFKEVDRRFEEIDRRFQGVDRRFVEVDRRLDKVEREVHDLRSEINLRFDSLQKTMILGFVSTFGMISATMATVVATQL